MSTWENGGTKRPRQDEDLFIDSSKCMDDYGEYDPSRPTAIQAKFKKIFKSIQDEGLKHNLTPAYALLMINRNFGYSWWGRIPYGREYDMVDFIKNNHHKSNHIIWPDEYGPDNKMLGMKNLNFQSM